MSWERPEGPVPPRFWRRALVAWLALSLLALLGTALARPAVERALRVRFGDPEVDARIDAAPVAVEATLITVDPSGPGRQIVSYEYYVDGVMYVGYARVPTPATVAWHRLEPLAIEVAEDRPDLSRPEGVQLHPNAWVTGLVPALTPLPLLLIVGGWLALRARG